MNPFQNISDEEISVAFENTNFGDDSPEFRRKLLAQGVLKKLVPDHSGHTLTTIMKELGLIAIHGKREEVYVTALGKKFLFAEFYQEKFSG